MGLNFSEYVLPNGLTVLLHEDHSNPLVHLDVTYHVGSNREELGKSGFAHFFEHMMFQGSKNVGDEMHFKYISDAGGTLNGTTNRDRTNYFETVPRDFLPLVLWLEADRMGFLLDSVTQEKFEVQRATVKNEKGQNYDNRPYGRSREVVGRALYQFYSANHPYSWLTIGDLEDLDMVNVNDLKKFFLTYYGPNNAVLTLGGDFKKEEALSWIEKYFSPILKGPEVVRLKPMVPVVSENRFVSYEDQVRFPMVSLTLPTVPMLHPDEGALDMLGFMLGSGKSSPLYKKFVKTGLANQSDAYHTTSEISGEFTISVRANPGTPLSSTYKDILSLLSEAEKSMTQDLLDQMKAQFEVLRMSNFESVRGKVSMMAYFKTFAGDASYIESELERYRKVSLEDVKRVFRQYILNKNAVVLSVVPLGKKELIVAPDNFSWKRGTYNYSGKAKFKYRVPKDNFDRSQPPQINCQPVVNPFNVQEENFTDGGKMFFAQHPESPRVHAVVSFDGGLQWDLEDTSKLGISYLFSRMLNESSSKRKAEEINAQLDAMGSKISIVNEENRLSANIECFEKDLATTIGVLYERLFDPGFDSAEFAVIKKQVIENVSNQANQPVEMANLTYRRAVYGKECVRGIPSSGTVRTLKNVTLQDLKKLHKKVIHSKLVKVYVVSPNTLDETKKAFRYLISWRSKDTLKARAEQFSRYSRPQLNTEIMVVHKPGAAQSELRVACPAIPYDAYGDYFKLGVMNYILGGSFNSRINLNLREKHGFTYGARSGFNSLDKYGHFVISAGVKRDKTDSSISEIISELKNWVMSGMTEEELNYAKNAISRSNMLDNETGSQVLQQVKEVADHQLQGDFSMRQIGILMSFQPQELNRLAGFHFNPDKMVIVVAGDVDVILKDLQKLGYRISEWSPEGEFMGYL